MLNTTKFQKHTTEVTVLTPVKFTNRDQSIEMDEHNSDVKNPWSVKKSKSKVYDIGRYDDEDDPHEISLLSEVHFECKNDLDAIICYLIIAGIHC